VQTRSAKVTITLVCLVFGALLMIQFRTQGKIAKAQLAESASDQTTIISNLYDANTELRREVAKLAVQQQDYQRSLEQSDLSDMSSELNKLRVFTGLAEVSGQGIELKVSADLRPEYVQDLINELRNAGAEAIAVNSQRVVARSAVTTDRGKVVVDGVILDAPYVFQAIGGSDTLDRALGRKGGMVSYLQNTYPDADITLTKRTQLLLPAYTGKLDLKNSQPTNAQP
jgi:uncharacterized protein YlxW (UPF0749 family)